MGGLLCVTSEAHCRSASHVIYHVRLQPSAPNAASALSAHCDLSVVDQVKWPEAAPYVLEGHEGEVTGVAWCPSDLGQV